MDYNIEKVRHISHEVKNQLSVCDLYTEIMERYCDKNGITDETILKSVSSIKRALQIANITLLELKSSDLQEIAQYELKSVTEEAYELAKVYGLAKNIKIILKSDTDCMVSIDKTRFQSVIINLVKNACEAFEEEPDKIITISTERENSIAKIIVSNNASPISNPEIFEEGYTTKTEGSGLGLYISRKNMEEMGGTLRLLKSDNISTDFEIMVRIINTDGVNIFKREVKSY